MLTVDGPHGRATHELIFNTQHTINLTADDLTTDGTIVEFVGFDLGWYATAPFRLVPWLAEGQYVITLFVDGVPVLGSEYDIRRSTEPWLQTITREAAPGDSVVVLLTGFAPGEDVPLGLYSWAEFEDPQSGLPIFELEAPVGTVTVNDEGWQVAEITVPTVGPALSDQYCVASPDHHPVDCSTNFHTQVLFIG